LDRPGDATSRITVATCGTPAAVTARGSSTTAATATTAALQSPGHRTAGILAMHTLMTALLIAAALSLGLLSEARAARPTAGLAPTPLNAIDAIIDAFRAHAVVALEEEHGDERAAAFRLSLVRDPRFSQAANDIVVEFGNARYQDVIDRFLAGGDVPANELTKVWQDTTLAHPIWDRPVYEDFFRAVRSINATLPEQRRLRVLLGDPPIDWATVRTTRDLQNASAGRSAHPADVILAKVLPQHRRALVVYGALHLLRKNPLQGPNLIDRIERDAAVHAFVVISHPFASLDAMGVNPASWPVPSLALTSGTGLEHQLDAVLYLGPVSGRRTSRLTPTLCGDRAYREMRTSRMLLAGIVAAAEALAKECDSSQQRPDFSGRWKPIDVQGDAARPTPQAAADGPPPPPRTLSLTITQSETELRVDRELETGTQRCQFLCLQVERHGERESDGAARVQNKGDVGRVDTRSLVGRFRG
jgi:hypothetical protein